MTAHEIYMHARLAGAKCSCPASLEIAVAWPAFTGGSYFYVRPLGFTGEGFE